MLPPNGIQVQNALRYGLRTYKSHQEDRRRMQNFNSTPTILPRRPLSTVAVIASGVVATVAVPLVVAMSVAGRLFYREIQITRRDETPTTVVARQRSEEAQIENKNVRDARITSRRVLMNIQSVVEANRIDIGTVFGLTTLPKYTRPSGSREDKPWKVVETVFKRHVIQCLWIEHEEVCATHALAKGENNAAQEVELYLVELGSQERIGALGLYIQECVRREKHEWVTAPKHLIHFACNGLPSYEKLIRQQLDRAGHLVECRKHARHVMIEATEIPNPSLRILMRRWFFTFWSS